MPFYKYRCGEEEIERIFLMSERPDELVEGGKIYEYIPEFSGSFILKGRGWASKNTALASKPRRGKEIGIAVDNDKRQDMQRAGEDV